MKDPFPVKIAGAGGQEIELRRRIRELGLEPRVTLLGPVDEAQLVEHYARCRAVWFAPHNEDYGFVTLEAFRSGKAVVTATDSGGPSELVVDGANGFVTAPTPEAVAGALDRLAGDPAVAERLGRQALRDSTAHTWEGAVSGLLR
jgi:glycosyltransferase involved in cell wall biosynthesis